jgi:hypothetical protein
MGAGFFLAAEEARAGERSTRGGVGLPPPRGAPAWHGRRESRSGRGLVVDGVVGGMGGERKNAFHWW